MNQQLDAIALDGDFKGHPFRGNQYKKAGEGSGTAVRSSMRAKHAEKRGDHKAAKSAHKSAHHSHMAAAEEAATPAARKYHKTMAKFHGSRAGVKLDSVAEFEHAPAYKEGTGKWHSYTMEAMKRKSDAQLRYIIKDATEAAEAGEKMGNPKAGQYRDEAHYASMELHRRKKGGKQVLDGVEGWDGIECEGGGYALDDASDFSPGSIVGKIMKGGVQVGRAVIGGDGKAMVFVGDSMDQRVKYVHPESGQSRDAVWADDGVKLVDWLLNPAKPPEVASDESDRVQVSEHALREMAEPLGITVSDVELLGGKSVQWAYVTYNGIRAKVEIYMARTWSLETVGDGPHIGVSAAYLGRVLDVFKEQAEKVSETGRRTEPPPEPTPAPEPTPEPTMPEPVEVERPPAKIMPRLAFHDPEPGPGWKIVGGGKGVPGYASESAAKIALSKNPAWKHAGAVILPFVYSDGGAMGLSRYDRNETRYAILVPDQNYQPTDQDKKDLELARELESINPETFIAVAADSVKKLRGVDLERVLSETPAIYREKVAAYIKSNRRELFFDVEDVMNDLKAKEVLPTPEPTMHDPKSEDRAFFLSVIDGSHPLLLEPELAELMSAAYERHSADSEMVSLFMQAGQAYTNAMMTATEGM